MTSFVLPRTNFAADLKPKPCYMKHSIPTSLKCPRVIALLILGLGTLVATPLWADLNSDLAFTAFHDVDVNILAGGNILQVRGPIMTFPRGITSQSLFFIPAAPADVAKKLLTWNPASHPDLMVWLHKSLPPQPTINDFADLANLPDNKSMQFQIDATAKFDPANPSLQVSKEEAQLISATAAQEKDPKTLFAKVWGQIILGRINDFLSGRGGAAMDMSAGGDVHPFSDVKSLLHSDIKIYGQYQRLLNQTPFKALAGTTAAKLAPSNLYCDIFDVQGSAAMGTGAIYQVPAGNSIQSLDVEYYTNYGVYATIELEQMWPMTVNGQAGTLVWRDDLVSAPNVAYLHGTERLASSMIMLQETKGGVEAFRAEFK
jgi:hypothetical protein